MWRLIIYFVGLLFIWLSLSQCFILRNRWSDKKSIKIFSSKHVPFVIHDTVINNQHLHFAISGSDTLPTLVFIHGSPGSWMNYAKYMWDSSLLGKYRMIGIDRPGFGYSDFRSYLPQQAWRPRNIKIGGSCCCGGYAKEIDVTLKSLSKQSGTFKAKQKGASRRGERLFANNAY